MADLDDPVRCILDTYTSLSYKPPHNQFTVLAAFFLSLPDSTFKIISLATGTKCLPTIKLPERGEALHDCHAEILARRAALRWFLEEIGRCHGSSPSKWIFWDSEHEKYNLRRGAHLNLYVSTLPCGDASTRYLAATQDEAMARLKESSGPTTHNLPATNHLSTAFRGRDGYSLLGVLRTKPGRADSPPTTCMSCSDKIASWNVLGIQGAVGSLVLGPLYISTLIIGELLNADSVGNSVRRIVEEDCERAFWARIADVKDLPYGYSVHKPVIYFTALPFPHSRTELTRHVQDIGPTNESLCWVPDRMQEILISGLKRGVSSKHRLRNKSRPLLCKYSIYQLASDILALLSPTTPTESSTYFEFKKTAERYREAKEALRGPGSPFSGWIISGISYESFYLEE